MALLNSPISMAHEILSEQLPPPPQLPDDVIALNLVLKDLARSEWYTLAKGITVELDRDDRLYLFRMPVAFWEGSSTPRSALGIPLTLEHIESLLPQYMQALYADDPPFSCTPRAKTTIDAAKAVTMLISKQLKDMGFEEELRLGLKESLTYGMGVWKAGWKREKRYRRVYKYAGQPEQRSVGAGMSIITPTEDSRRVVESLEEYEINAPCIEKVHIRHILVDPSLRVPDLRQAKYLIHRMYPTLEDLLQLKNQPGYNLPSEEFLRTLYDPPRESAERSVMEGRSTSSVLNTGISSLDINMEFKAMPRWQSPSEDPNQQPLEMLEYVTKDRTIVVLNRKLCIKNDINEFGCINFFSVPPIDVLDSWYGIGIVKLLSGEQRLQQGIINSRLDDLSLRLSGTFLRKRGANTPTQQLRLRPGGIIDSDDDKGVQMLQYPPAIMDAFTEVEASDSRAQRRSGANEIVTQGAMSHPSSIGRTASGINTLAAGVGARSAYFVDFVSRLFIVPFLELVHEMNSRWLPIEDLRAVLTEELEEAYKGDAIEIKNANVKFNMQAGTKMRAKQGMLQLAQPLMQFFSLQPVLESMQDQETKFNFAKFAQQVLDAVDWPGQQEIVSPMTAEDKQRLAQKNEMMQQMSMINQKNQGALQQIEAKGLSQSGTHIIKSLVDEQSGLTPDHKVQLLKILSDAQANAQQGQAPQQPQQGQSPDDPLGLLGNAGQ
jgi:hypothetical protein